MRSRKIGFFGHSACAGEGVGTYLTSVADHFDAKIVNKGVGQGSEERILYFLKKCHDIDIAVIYHSRPTSLFLPHCTKDFDIALNSLKVKEKASIIWNTLENSPDIIEDAFNEPYGNFREVFKTSEEFINCIISYKKFLYDPDLQMNRFQGAMALIDDYCSKKVPATVHIIDPRYKPAWLGPFKSGVESTDIADIVLADRGHYVNHRCGLSPVGHEKITKILIDLISNQLNLGVKSWN